MFSRHGLDRESIDWAARKNKWKTRGLKESVSEVSMKLVRRGGHPKIGLVYDQRGKLLSAQRGKGRYCQKSDNADAVKTWLGEGARRSAAGRYAGGQRGRFGISRMPFLAGTKRLAFAGTCAYVLLSTSSTIWFGFGAVAYGVYVVWRMSRPA